MATVVNAATAIQEPAAVPDVEIRVYGHGTLFYWWPVWLTGFILAFLTYLDGHVMAVVPPGTQVESTRNVPGAEGKSREVLVPPPGTTVPAQPGATEENPEPRLLVSANNNYGVVFIGVLLLTIVVTNFIFRGLASVIAVAAIVIAILFVALMGWWNDVLIWLGGLDIRMNAGGYLAIAVPLFLIWLFATFVYDHYTYLIVTRGQVRIRQQIGEGETVVDTSGLVLEKERNDLFRHWLVGLGSGDLHVKTGGPANLDFELSNVLFINRKLSWIQDLLREKEVAEQGVSG
ncbi:MAG TPA: hypothetical protein VLM40_23935 [Gemmata sp.]|nr:hypothetical protein [Gemmata sp.]